MNVASVLKRHDIFVPAWNGNRNQVEADQIRIEFRWPTYEDLGDLPTLSAGAALAAMVLARIENLSQWNAISLSGMIKAMADQEFSKGLTMPVDLDEKSLRKELHTFALTYCRQQVLKVHGLGALEIQTGEDLVKAPAEALTLILETAFHIWAGQSLEKKSSDSRSVSSSTGTARRKDSKTSSRTVRLNRTL